MKRGIITPSYSVFEDGDCQGFDFNLNIDDLLYFSLYWDQIAIPTNNFFNMQIPQEESFVASGVLIKPFSFRSSITIGDVQEYLEDLVTTAQNLNKTNDIWSIHHFSDTALFPKSHAIQKDAIKFELFNCLPVPINPVSIYDILEFKFKRQDELGQLHSSLNQFYRTILNEAHDQEALKKEIKYNLGKAIQDLDQSFVDRFKARKTREFKVELDISTSSIFQAVSTLPATLFADSHTGLSIPIATMVTTLGSFLKIGFNQTYTISGFEKNLQLNYLSSAKSERII